MIRYARNIDPHPLFARDGVNPHLHHLLTNIAASEGRYPESGEIATVILGLGRTDLFPKLGQALAAEGHPDAKTLRWNRVGRAVAIDRAMLDTHVMSGSDNQRVVRFAHLSPFMQMVTAGDPQGDVRRSTRMAEYARRAVPDASDREIRSAFARLRTRADLLHRGQNADWWADHNQRVGATHQGARNLEQSPVALPTEIRTSRPRDPRRMSRKNFATRPRRYSAASEADFHASMNADPNGGHHVIYADWLADQGREHLANLVRSMPPDRTVATSADQAGFHAFGPFRDGAELVTGVAVPDLAKPGQKLSWYYRDRDWNALTARLAALESEGVTLGQAARHTVDNWRKRMSRRGRPVMMSRENLHSWLAPNGVFHPVNGGKSHEQWLIDTGKFRSVPDAIASGWQRVNHIGDQIYTNGTSPPNQRQLAALVDAAIENGMAEVVHDNDENERTLWTNRDRLSRLPRGLKLRLSRAAQAHRYAKRVRVGFPAALFQSRRHKSGENQTGRLLRRIASGNLVNDSHARNLAAAAHGGDYLSLGVLHDRLEEIEHPLADLNWRGLRQAAYDHRAAFKVFGLPGYLDPDGILFRKPGAYREFDPAIDRIVERSMGNGPYFNEDEAKRIIAERPHRLSRSGQPVRYKKCPRCGSASRKTQSIMYRWRCKDCGLNHGRTAYATEGGMPWVHGGKKGYARPVKYAAPLSRHEVLKKSIGELMTQKGMGDRHQVLSRDEILNNPRDLSESGLNSIFMKLSHKKDASGEYPTGSVVVTHAPPKIIGMIRTHKRTPLLWHDPITGITEFVKPRGTNPLEGVNQSPEIDWRPNETTPEDFYSMSRQGRPIRYAAGPSTAARILESHLRDQGMHHAAAIVRGHYAQSQGKPSSVPVSLSGPLVANHAATGRGRPLVEAHGTSTPGRTMVYLATFHGPDVVRHGMSMPTAQAHDLMGRLHAEGVENADRVQRILARNHGYDADWMAEFGDRYPFEMPPEFPPEENEVDWRPNEMIPEDYYGYARRGRPRRYAASDADFHAAIHDNPNDSVPPLVYADYLDENGRPGHAEVIRRSVAHRQQQNEPPVNVGETYWSENHAPGRSIMDASPDGLGGFQSYFWIRPLSHPRSRLFFKFHAPREDMQRLLQTVHNEGGEVKANPVWNPPAKGQPHQYEAYRAPAGGSIVRSIYYPGGSLIPDLKKFAPTRPARRTPR